MSSAATYIPGSHIEAAAAPAIDFHMSGAFAPTVLLESTYQQAGRRTSMSVAPSKAASLATLASVILAAIGIFGQILFGGFVFGMLSAFAFAILAAIVLSYGH
jgi:hypothetical protein